MSAVYLQINTQKTATGLHASASRSGLCQWTDVLQLLESAVQRSVLMATKPTLDIRMQGYNWTVLFRSTAKSNATSNNNKINHICVDVGEKKGRWKKGKLSGKEQDLTNICVNTNLLN